METIKNELAEEFTYLQGITASEKGITRLAYSDADWQGREYVKGLMVKAGLAVREDAFGNVIGRLEGTEPDLAPIMIGSHMDSVPEGGNYDGVTGVLTGLAAARLLKQEGLRRPLEVIIFMAEEGSRFGSATLGSRALIGDLGQEELDRLTTEKGQTLREVLLSRNLRPELIGKPLYPEEIKAFFEVHIEQGKVLEEKHFLLGIVTGIAAPSRFRVHLHGSADHSGATPMEIRRDALCGAAEIILAVERLAAAEENPAAVGTVGFITAEPGAFNVIPGEVTLGIDIRSISSEVKDRVCRLMKTEVEAICRSRQLTGEVEDVSTAEPVELPPAMISLLEDSCRALNVKALLMPSGAGHDAMFMAQKTDVAMLFIPCRDGISHNPNEHAELDDIVRGIKVITEAIRRVDKQE